MQLNSGLSGSDAANGPNTALGSSLLGIIHLRRIRYYDCLTKVNTKHGH